MIFSNIDIFFLENYKVYVLVGAAFVFLNDGVNIRKLVNMYIATSTSAMLFFSKTISTLFY